MKNSLDKIKKRLKGDTIFLYFLSILFLSLSATSIYTIVKYSMFDVDKFELRYVGDEDEKYYASFVNGEEMDYVNYNDVCNISEEDIPRYIKASSISKEAQNAVQGIFIGLIIMSIYMIFSEINKGNTPFQNKSIRYLRIAAVLTICEAFVAFGIKILIMNTMLSSVSIYSRITPSDIFIIAIGVFIGMISEIFEYGCVLQEDSDSIA